MKGNIDDWLTFIPTGVKGGGKRGIPELRLYIGKYGNDNEAYIDINARSIPNTQIVIAGSTGSGKTNLLAVLINQIRSISMDSAYPVNFLLFDYKGEFSDPQNASWLSYFNVNSDCILNPLKVMEVSEVIRHQLWVSYLTRCMIHLRM
jgi:type IV secretory pathway VirB4 component